jgi:hypothetical protein
MSTFNKLQVEKLLNMFDGEDENTHVEVFDVNYEGEQGLMGFYIPRQSNVIDARLTFTAYLGV